MVTLSPETTSITFTLKATMHTVHGAAALERGEFVFNTGTGAASGEAVVAATTADTDNKKRDKKMHAKVLRTEQHPNIVFHAASFEGTLLLEGSSDLTLVGAVELLGATHPIRVPVTVTIDGDMADAEASFEIPYVAWGLDDPSSFVLRVGKTVPVTVLAEGVSVTRAEPEL